MKIQDMDGNPVFFLCDRKACGGKCPNSKCYHTNDILHAKNFDAVNVNDKLVDYFELDPHPDIVRT